MVLTAACGAWLYATSEGEAANGRGSRTKTPRFKPVMSVHQLMIEQDHHFDAILDLFRDQDVPEFKGKLRHEALALAEMANINGYQKRATKHADYREWAAQLKAQAIEVATLAKAKKFDEAKQLARSINKTCKRCHHKYKD